MGNFYPHNIKESRRTHAAFMEKAKAANVGDLVLAERAIIELQHVVANGLPDCYKSFHDFLSDFYPDFSWNHEQMVKEIDYILNDNRFSAIDSSIKKDWDFDMREDLLRVYGDE